MPYNQSVLNVYMPDRVRRLPISREGYPVPWFVGKVNGEWDFRGIGPGKIEEAIRKNRCWVCGEPLGVHMTFPIGPMCAINRTISEPPSHYECAVFAVRACPFLVNPRMRRNEKDIPEHQLPAGNMIRRNPGVTCLWTTKHFNIFQANGGILFKIGPPERTEWYCEGRPATRAEVEASIESGIPLLMDVAMEEGTAAVDQLRRQIAQAKPLLPRENT